MRKQNRDKKKKQFKYIRDHKKNDKFVDPDALNEKGDNKTLREIAGLGAVLGAGAAGMAFMPNNTVHAAEQIADQKSAVVGSTVKSEETSTVSSETNKSEDNSTVTSETKQENESSETTSITTSESDQANQSETNSNAENQNSTTETASATKSEVKSNVGSKVSSTASNPSLTQANSLKEGTSTKATSNVSLTQSNNQISGIASTSNGSASLNISNVSSQASLSGSASDATSLENSLSISRATLSAKGLSDAAIAKMLGASFIADSTGAPTGAKEVKTVADLVNYAKDTSVTSIVLDGDITIPDGNYPTFNHTMSIYGNGHNIVMTANTNLRINSASDPNSQDASHPAVVTFNDVNTYSASQYGAFYLGPDGGTLVLNNVTMTGGTSIYSRTDGNGLKTIEIKGNVTSNMVQSFTIDGTTANTYFYSDKNNNGQNIGSTQIYGGNHMIIDDGAHLTLNGNKLVDVGISLKDKGHSGQGHNTLSVGNNAVLDIDGSNNVNILMNQLNNYYIAFQGNNNFTVGIDATVNLSAGHANLVMGNNTTNDSIFRDRFKNNITIGQSTVKMNVTNGSKWYDGNIIFGGDKYYEGNKQTDYDNFVSSQRKLEGFYNNSTVNINNNANVTLTVYGKAANIISNRNTVTVVNITDPQQVVLINWGGRAYKTTGADIRVNTDYTNVQVTNTNDSTTWTSDYISSGSSKVNNAGIVTPVSNTIIESMKDKNSTPVDQVLKWVTNARIKKVVYNGATIPSQSASTSARQSLSDKSLSQASASNSASQSASDRKSVV